MKFKVEGMLSAVAMLSECPNVRAIETSQVIRVRKQNGQLIMKLASGVQAVGAVPTDEMAGKWQTFVDRATFLQFWAGCKKQTADTATLVRGDAKLELKVGKRRAKFPELVSVQGYGRVPSSDRTKMPIEDEVVEALKLAANFTGGEGLPEELSCVYMTANEVLSSNQLQLCRIGRSFSTKGPIPVELTKYLLGDVQLFRTPYGSCLQKGNGVLFYPYELAALRKFPGKRILEVLQTVKAFPVLLTLTSLPEALEILLRLQSFAVKGEREDLQVRVVGRPREPLRLGVKAAGGELWEELDEEVEEPIDFEILTPPLIPLLRYLPEDAELKFAWEGDDSPFYISGGDAELLITRKVF